MMRQFSLHELVAAQFWDRVRVFKKESSHLSAQYLNAMFIFIFFAFNPSVWLRLSRCLNRLNIW